MCFISNTHRYLELEDKTKNIAMPNILYPIPFKKNIFLSIDWELIAKVNIITFSKVLKHARKVLLSLLFLVRTQSQHGRGRAGNMTSAAAKSVASFYNTEIP